MSLPSRRVRPDRPRRSGKRARPRPDRSAELAALIMQLRMAILAGLPIRRAAIEVFSTSRAAEIRAVAQRLALGLPLGDSLFGDVASLEPRTLRLFRALERLEIDGADAVPHLDALASDIERDRIAAIDIASQRIGVALLFPLVLCILPAFVCLAVVPLVLDVVEPLVG